GDVYSRISGRYRESFPAQIALIDAAVRAVAAREEAADENPLAAACRVSAHAGASIARIFGTAPGAYGTGVEDLLGRDIDREHVASAYLPPVSHPYRAAAPAPALPPAPLRPP